MIIAIDETFLEHGSVDGMFDMSTWDEDHWHYNRLLKQTHKSFREIVDRRLITSCSKICPDSIRTDDLMSQGPFQAYDRELNGRQCKEQRTCQIKYLYPSYSLSIICSNR